MTNDLSDIYWEARLAEFRGKQDFLKKVLNAMGYHQRYKGADTYQEKLISNIQAEWKRIKEGVENGTEKK